MAENPRPLISTGKLTGSDAASGCISGRNAESAEAASVVLGLHGVDCDIAARPDGPLLTPLR
jgi:hypothetical protein